MQTFWGAFDDALVAAVTTDLAAGGLYDSLEIEEAFVGEFVNIDRVTLPVVMVRGVTAEGRTEIHGDGQAHGEYTYPYLLVAYTTAESYQEAKRDGQEFIVRLRKIVARRSLYSVQGDDGEKPTLIEPGGEFLELRGRQGQSEGRTLAVAAVEFTVKTEV